MDLHPNFRQRIEAERQREEKLREKYLKHFSPAGLSQHEVFEVSGYIVQLGQKTGEYWLPKHCRTIPYLSEEANAVYNGSGIRRFFSPLVPKRFLHSHFFWLSASNDSTKKLILDPTGVPKDFTNYANETIIPYFGLLEHAPLTNKTVYASMEDMDDWGTRDLPPGFHP